MCNILIFSGNLLLDPWYIVVYRCPFKRKIMAHYFWQFEVSLLFCCQNFESGWLRVQIFSQTMDFLDFRCCEFCFHCCLFFCPLYKHSVVIAFRMEVKYILVMFTQIQISLRKPEKMRYFGVRFWSFFFLIMYFIVKFSGFAIKAIS